MRFLKTLAASALVIAASLVVLTGAQAAISSKLSVYSANPHYFSNGGTPVVLLGSGQPLPGHKTESYISQIDTAAAHKVNYIRLWLLPVWEAGADYYPWARTGPGTANDGQPKFDLTKWDTAFWANLKDCISYAQSKNIYVDVMFFDECGIEPEHSTTSYKYHPFNPANNINGVGLPSADAVPEFYSLSNATLKTLQEQYVSQMISQTSGYPNVIYEICNEYTGPTDWENYWIGFVRGKCSNIIAVNRLGSAPSTYWTDSRINMVNFHWGCTDTASTTNNMRSNVTAHSKAVNYDETPEIAGISYTTYRNMVWGCFVGGGHFHLENGENSGAANDAVLYLRGFIDSNAIQFWNMTPNNGLVTKTPGGSAYTLAKAGSQYVVYISGSGSGSMTVSLASGYTYAATAYNPSTGAYTNLSVSGNTVSGIPSYSSDIVVYIKATGGSGGGTTSNPSMTLSIATSNSTAAPGGTVTYTLTYKNTGGAAASNVTIQSALPAYTTYVSGGTYDSTNKIVKWTLSSVAAGAGGTLTYSVKIQ